MDNDSNGQHTNEFSNHARILRKFSLVVVQEGQVDFNEEYYDYPRDGIMVFDTSRFGNVSL